MGELAIVIKLKGKRAYVVNEEGAFETIKKIDGMFIGQKVFYSQEDKIKQSSNSFKYYYAGLAGLAALFIFAYSFYRINYTQDTYAYVHVDINPSIELVIDEKGKVLKATPINEDADRLLKDFKYRGMSLNKVILNLFYTSEDYGFIDDKSKENFILISSAFTDKLERIDGNSKNESILDTMFAALKNDVKASHINVNMQFIEFPLQYRTEALEHKISMGCYFVYQKVQEKGSNISLGELKVQRLYDVLLKNGIEPFNIKSIPMPSSVSIQTPCPTNFSTPTKVNEFQLSDIQKSTSTTKAVNTPATKAVNTPATKAVNTPTTKAVSTPTTKQISTPTTKAVNTATTKPVSTPTTKALSTRTTKAINTATTKPVSTPKTKPVSTPKTKPITTPTLKSELAHSSMNVISATSTPRSERTTKVLSKNTTVRSDASNGKANTGIKVQLYNYNAVDQTVIAFIRMKVINNGSEPINLKDVTVRYYYTIDGYKDQSLIIDWSSIGANYMTGEFVKMDDTKDNADMYLEIGFKSNASVLKPGDSAEMTARFNKEDWSGYNQYNDYSFNDEEKFTDCKKVPAYISGNLVWGVEP